MNQLSPHHNLARESQMSEMVDQQKLIEGQEQLEDEAESRARRIKMRRQRQAKLAAMRSQTPCARLSARWILAAGYVWRILRSGVVFQ